jgi:plastocyanin
MSMRRAAIPALLLALSTAGVMLVCCKKDEAPAAQPSAPAATATPAPAAAKAGLTSGGGGVKGTVVMTGTPPERKEVNMKADPYCAGKQGDTKDEEVITGAGGVLKNAVVRIAMGLTEKYSPPAEDITVDQTGCMYRPRVQVASAGQTVIIRNSDQTLHNVHTYSGPSTLFNQAQVSGMPPLKKKFPRPGDVVKFKCDVHPWMTGYVLVTDNPFRAVTGDDGGFNLHDIPPGEYTLEVWHERLGTKQVKVTIAADKTQELKIELAAK